MPEAMTEPSELVSSGCTGSAGVIPARCASTADSALPMNEVWNAPATGSGMTRTPAGGFASQLGECVDGSGGDDLPAAVDVGPHQVQFFQRRQHGVRVAAHQCGHPGRGQGAGRAHRAAADRGQIDCVQRGQNSGEGGRGQLANRVPGNDGAGRNVQALGRQQTPSRRPVAG